MNELEKSWKDHEPAPLEQFHSLLMEKFHELRKKQNGPDPEIKAKNPLDRLAEIRSNGHNYNLSIGGVEFNNLIAQCKKEVYSKYKNQVSPEPIHKAAL